MNELHPHLQALHDALRIEERAERTELERLDAMPLEDQISAGHAWPRLRLSGVEPVGRGSRAVARAPRGVELHDGLSAGDAVWIEVNGGRRPGWIERVDRGVAELRIGAEPPPDGAVAIVHARHDPTTFVRFRQALERADEHRSGLKRVLLGESLPAVVGGTAEIAGLDEAQRRAAQHALKAPELAVVHGPPGTGKTRLLGKVLAVLVREGDRPWALADSNAAVDNLALAAAAEGLDVVRVGPVARIGAALEDLTLEARMRRSPLGPALHTIERELVRAWGTPAGPRLLRDRNQLRADAKAHALSTASVIATTFGTLARLAPDLPPVRTAVVDEATQATEPAIWVAVPYIERLVLVGDPHQLGPVSKVPGSLLERSLLERLVTAGAPLPMLATQHRMVTPIRSLVRDVYGPGYVDAVPSDAGGVLFVDTAGAAEEARDPATLSMYSDVEARLVALAVAPLRAEGLDVGVIAPYSAQVARIRARVPEVEVATVNAFQGREKEAIVVSFVRSNSEGELGFVADGRRLTVALTRAKRRLVLIGDAATLGRHPRFAALLEMLAARGAVQSVWEEPWVEALG